MNVVTREAGNCLFLKIFWKNLKTVPPVKRCTPISICYSVWVTISIIFYRFRHNRNRDMLTPKKILKILKPALPIA